jgi:DNA-binding response OmpR family regulator
MSNILIVEDEEFLIRTLEDNLIAEGYKVDVVKNGESAIKKIGKKKPALILLDLLMPKKDGFYVLEEIKKHPEWKIVPVIVLSNLGDDTAIKRALQLGADDYFVKSQHPIQEVVEKAKEYLEGGKAAKHRPEKSVK